MAITPWKDKTNDPLKELWGLDDFFKRTALFPTINRNIAEFGNVWYPCIDVSEDDSNIYLRADLPGINREDIEISMEEDVLTIKGERKIEEEKKGKNHYIIERGYGSFSRSIQLGSGVQQDKINAKYKDGVLEVVLPKTEKEKPKKINISAS